MNKLQNTVPNKKAYVYTIREIEEHDKPQVYQPPFGGPKKDDTILMQVTRGLRCGT